MPETPLRSSGSHGTPLQAPAVRSRSQAAQAGLRIEHYLRPGTQAGTDVRRFAAMGLTGLLGATLIGAAHRAIPALSIPGARALLAMGIGQHALFHFGMQQEDSRRAWKKDRQNAHNITDYQTDLSWAMDLTVFSEIVAQFIHHASTQGASQLPFGAMIFGLLGTAACKALLFRRPTLAHVKSQVRSCRHAGDYAGAVQWAEMRDWMENVDLMASEKADILVAGGYKKEAAPYLLEKIRAMESNAQTSLSWVGGFQKAADYLSEHLDTISTLLGAREAEDWLASLHAQRDEARLRSEERVFWQRYQHWTVEGTAIYKKVTLEAEYEEESDRRMGQPGPAWSAVLGVSATADAETVRTAATRLIFDHHPRRGGDRETLLAVLTAYKQYKRSVG